MELPVPLDEPAIYPHAANQIIMPIQPILVTLSPNSLFPAIADDALLAPIPTGMPMVDKLPDTTSAQLPIPPLIRGFSDLDTLAQAAETFDPYYQAGI
jgi:hypothetical protein